MDVILPKRPRINPVSPVEVRLTAREDQLCTLLDEFCASLNSQKPEMDPVMCRIAGGWVRDKLLGMDSDDIDIAINRMTGEAFAQGLLDSRKIESAGATIASNPEQSKHLATTKIKLLDYEVDLVNLRSESYTEDSRIPEIAFGTPQEDAERRDLTINAMFYNVHSRAIEDLTGKGIEDLKSGRIRTPLDPKTTFEDDPLRILRCVRFASRLGFDVAESISIAAKEPEIQTRLATKISRERIGIEIEKMIKGPDPLYAISLLHSFDLLPAILTATPHALETADSEVGSMQRAVDGLRTVELLLSSNDKLPALSPSLLEVVQNDKSTRARIRLAALLTPFRWILFEEKKKKIPLVDSVIRDGLKLGSMNFYLNGIPPLFKGAELIRKGFPDPLTTGSRAQIGILLRNTSIHYPVVGAEWSSSLFFALVQEVVDCWSDEGLDEVKASECIQRYNSLAETIQRYNLAESIKAPPIIDGKIVCHTLNIRPGPHMGPIMDRIIHWQLENPDKDVGDCEAWLKEEGTKGTFGPLPPASRGVGEGSSKKKGR